MKFQTTTLECIAKQPGKRGIVSAKNAGDGLLGGLDRAEIELRHEECISDVRTYRVDIPLRDLRVESMVEFLERRKILKLHPELIEELEIAKAIVLAKTARLEIRKYRTESPDSSDYAEEKVPVLVCRKKRRGN